MKEIKVVKKGGREKLLQRVLIDQGLIENWVKFKVTDVDVAGGTIDVDSSSSTSWF